MIGTKMRQFVNQGYKEFNRCTAGLVVHSQKSHELTVIYDAEAGDEVSDNMFNEKYIVLFCVCVIK